MLALVAVVVRRDVFAIPVSLWLSTNRLSDNVGGVKQFWSTLQRALGEERHFALDESALSNPGSLV